MSVVVGFIPTPVGFAALGAASAEAGRRGGPLVVANIVRPGDDGDVRHARPDQLEEARERLRRSAPVRVDVRQVSTEGSIADALVRLVDEERAELLVIGIRRGEGEMRHLIGTTAQRLLVDAACDVLVV